MKKIFTTLIISILAFQYTYAQTIEFESPSRLGIGTSSPATFLHVEGDGSSNGMIRIQSTGATGWHSFRNDQGYIGYSGIFNGPKDMDFGTGQGNTDGKVNLVIAGVPKFMIDHEGRAGFGVFEPTTSFNIKALELDYYTFRAEDFAGAPNFWVSQDGHHAFNHFYPNVSVNIRGTAGDPWFFAVEHPGGGDLFNVLENGNVEVVNNLSKGGGSFKIDHPLDPENKYLYHSFVESPDMMNVYNGNIITDADGIAIVELPDYFMSLNRDFRYQLTVVGTFAQSIIKEKIKENQFVIQTNEPHVEVSWQITGIRKDPYANKNRIPIEEDKTQTEKGFYLHPDAYGQSSSKRIVQKRNRTDL